MVRKTPDLLKITDLQQEISNLTDAIASGLLKHSPALAERLNRSEAELSKLTAEPVNDNSERIEKLIPRLPEKYRKLVEELEETVLRDVDRGRAAIRRLLSDQIVMEPAPGGEFLRANVGLEMQLAALGGQYINMVAGAGFEPTTFGL